MEKGLDIEMSDFRRVAHLEEQIGVELFEILTNPENTGKVRVFCTQIVLAGLPTEMTIGGRTYEILDILRGVEENVGEDLMIRRAKEMGANLGENDGAHLLKHQDEIPAVFRRMINFIFPKWRRPGNSAAITGLNWIGNNLWAKGWRALGYFYAHDRLLRRK